MGLFLVSGSALGIGIDIYSTVNPNYNDSWNQDTLAGTALYTIWVLPDSQYGANVFSVTFESDIFASLGTAGLLAPPGWTLTYENPPVSPFGWSTHCLRLSNTTMLPDWIGHGMKVADGCNQ